MAKFSELVKFRNDLSKIIYDLSLSNDINKRIDILNGLKDDNNQDHSNLILSLIKDFEEQIDANQHTIATAQKIVNDTEILIDQLGIQLFGKDQSNFKPGGQIELDDELAEYLKIRIGHYCSWQYPAMILYANHKMWIDNMVASDPLYLTYSGNMQNLKKMISGYEQLYQNRLRLYEINNNDFTQLPQQQFSFILAWNIFNYVSMDSIAEYLAQLNRLLRAGGVLMFSYNNCDTEIGARLCEISAAGYASSRSINQIIANYGFELIKFENIESQDSIVSWVELRKPGHLSTVKAHQALAEIKRK